MNTKRVIKIAKLGGASLTNATSFRHAHKIIKKTKPDIVVVSGVGKSTNALVQMFEGAVENNHEKIEAGFNLFKIFHDIPISELFPRPKKPNGEKTSLLVHDVYSEILKIMAYLERYANEMASGIHPPSEHARIRDKIIAQAEILSSFIMSESLKLGGTKNQLYKAYNLIYTDNNFGNANVDWEMTKAALLSSGLIETIKKKIPIVTQGFIAGTYFRDEKVLSTLGRGAGDYTAALLARLLYELGLGNPEVTLYKDVAGVANRNPKKDSDEPLHFYKHLSYPQLKDMVATGGTAEGLIYQKTITELEKFRGSLSVKSFWDFEEPGTLIC